VIDRGYDAGAASKRSVDDVASGLDPPVSDLEMHLEVWPYGARIRALHAGEEVGWCGIQTDLTQGGVSPSLGGWAWLDELGVRDEWRNRCIASARSSRR
jgi:hypothetical protein